jgi:Bacterial Ig-like domain (group 2)
MEGGFWRTDGHFDPVLRLKNVLLKQPLTVTPSLFFADGTEYKLPAVTLEPAGTAQINIRYALQDLPANLQSHLSAYGMAGISYQWSWPAVIATVQNTDETASLTFTSSFRSDVRTVHASPENGRAQIIRGTWWLPTANADAFVLIENASLLTKNVDVQFFGHAGNMIGEQHVRLQKHGTTMVQLGSSIGGARGVETSGGMEIHYTGPDHGIAAYAGLVDEDAGFSASPVLFESHLDPARPAHEVVLSAPGIMLGNPDPAMQFPSNTYFKPYTILHNISAHALSVNLSLDTEASAGSFQTQPLGTVQLAPGETSQFDFDKQFGSANPLPDGFGHISATFQGQDGDLLMQSGSTDASKSYVFEVGVSQQADSASRTICFWSVEGDNNTMITVWNYKTTAQDLVLTLHYSGGQYVIPIHLEARRSYNLDMMSLVRSRIPDPSGTLIPSNINSGSAMLSSPKSEFDKISVAIAASVFNVRNATCGGVCNTCNGVTFFGFSPNAYSVPVGRTVNPTVQMTMNTGTTTNNPSGGTWTSQSTSIATVNSSGTVTGISVGSDALGFGLIGVLVDAGTICSSEEINCPTEDVDAESTANVIPMVTFSPTFIGVAQGGTQSVSVSLSGASTSSTPITLTLTTTGGTGAAIFTSGGTIAPGGASTTITSDTTVVIQGATASSTAGNIMLDATIPSETSTQEDATNPFAFSGVSVSLSLQTSGSPAFRNPDFPFANLGVQVANGVPPGFTSCPAAFQVTGMVTPSNYTGPIYLRKNVLSGMGYVDPSGSTYPVPVGDDTSDTALETQSGGGVYELDDPTFYESPFATGTTLRYRVNFDGYAVLGKDSSTTKVSTQDLNFFIRTSCKKASSISVVLDSTYSGDNQIGIGSTNTSDNLQ